MELRYETQRVALPFYYIMVVLFVVQIGLGLVLAVQETNPLFLQGILNFNIARSMHLNLAIFWLVSGFIGTIFYITPLLSGRDLKGVWFAKLLAVLLPIIAVWDMCTLPLAMRGDAGYALGEPWLERGMAYLEGGMVTDILIAIGFGILLYVVYRTLPKVKKWNELHWALALGVGGLFIIWFFAMVNVPNLDLQEYFRWFVVHYWVEGIWEILHITIIGFLLMTFFGAQIEEVGFAVFWGVAMIALSGLLGNAHHYFWIGTPSFWQFWGSLFSALEPLPVIFCFWHVYLDASHGKIRVLNLPAFYFLLGSAVLEMVGAGILGFSMTFAATNVWEHGTWVTLSHAHLALFGTFGMLVIGAAYAALPALKGVKDFDQRIGKAAFWFSFIGMIMMALIFAFGGSVEVYVYRILGLSWFSGQVLPAMSLWKNLLIPAGMLFAVGAGLIAYDLLNFGAHRSQELPLMRSHTPVRWMTGFEFSIWVLVFWAFGFIVTGGLLSYNLPAVRAGNALLPYTMAGVGYVGLFASCVAFVVRFVRLFELRQRQLIEEEQAEEAAHVHVPVPSMATD